MEDPAPPSTPGYRIRYTLGPLLLAGLRFLVAYTLAFFLYCVSYLVPPFAEIAEGSKVFLQVLFLPFQPLVHSDSLDWLANSFYASNSFWDYGRLLLWISALIVFLISMAWAPLPRQTWQAMVRRWRWLWRHKRASTALASALAILLALGHPAVRALRLDEAAAETAVWRLGDEIHDIKFLSDEHVVLTCEASAAYVSRDGGRIWTRSQPWCQRGSVMPAGEKLYCFGSNGRNHESKNFAISSSVDGGGTWTPFWNEDGLIAGRFATSSVLVGQTLDLEMWIAPLPAGGLYPGWARNEGVSSRGIITDIVSLSDGSLLACRIPHLIESRNGGRNWREIRTLGAEDPTWMVASKSGEVFWGFNSESKIMRSLDRASTWQIVFPGRTDLRWRSISCEGEDRVVVAGYDMPNRRDRGVLAWTLDGGKKWDLADVPFHINCVRFTPSGELWIGSDYVYGFDLETNSYRVIGP